MGKIVMKNKASHNLAEPENIKQRAIRRHHIARLKRNRSDYWAGYAKSSKRISGIVVNTPHPCSGHLCSNPRKISGGTMQEKRSDTKAKGLDLWRSKMTDF